MHIDAMAECLHSAVLTASLASLHSLGFAVQPGVSSVCTDGEGAQSGSSPGQTRKGTDVSNGEIIRLVQLFLVALVAASSCISCPKYLRDMVP